MFLCHRLSKSRLSLRVRFTCGASSWTCRATPCRLSCACFRAFLWTPWRLHLFCSFSQHSFLPQQRFFPMHFHLCLSCLLQSPARGESLEVTLCEFELGPVGFRTWTECPNRLLLQCVGMLVEVLRQQAVLMLGLFRHYSSELHATGWFWRHRKNNDLLGGLSLALQQDRRRRLCRRLDMLVHLVPYPGQCSCSPLAVSVSMPHMTKRTRNTKTTMMTKTIFSVFVFWRSSFRACLLLHRYVSLGALQHWSPTAFAHTLRLQYLWLGQAWVECAGQRECRLLILVQ